MIQEYLGSGKAGVKDALYFFLLDKQILRVMRMVSLDPEAVGLLNS